VPNGGGRPSLASRGAPLHSNGRKRRPALSQPPTDDDLVASINDSLFVYFFVFRSPQNASISLHVKFLPYGPSMHGTLGTGQKRFTALRPEMPVCLFLIPMLARIAPCASKFERSFGADPAWLLRRSLSARSSPGTTASGVCSRMQQSMEGGG
jgi:hypothetical protein